MIKTDEVQMAAYQNQRSVSATGKPNRCFGNRTSNNRKAAVRRRAAALCATHIVWLNA